MNGTIAVIHAHVYMLQTSQLRLKCFQLWMKSVQLMMMCFQFRMNGFQLRMRCVQLRMNGFSSEWKCSAQGEVFSTQDENVLLRMKYCQIRMERFQFKMKCFQLRMIWINYMDEGFSTQGEMRSAQDEWSVFSSGVGGLQLKSQRRHALRMCLQWQ